MRKAFLVLLLASLLLPAAARAAEREFLSGYAGVVPQAKEDRAKTYFYRPEVMQLLTALERGPVSETAVAQILGDKTPLRDLVRLGLVKNGNGTVRIAFAYFTAADMQAIHAAAAKYVPRLVAAFRARQGALDAALARYPVAGVSKQRLAFVLIAGFGLNWDALELTREKHYRAPTLIRGKDWSYSFWASEEVPDYSYKGYYWGSSSFPAGAMNLTPPLDFVFSSFGDPDSDPRMNFPDLLAIPPDQMTPGVKTAAEALGLHDDNSLGMGLKNVIGLDRGRSLGAILFALRKGARNAAAICGGGTECAGELGLLAAAGYVRKTGGGYELTVPVFDNDDRTMVQEVLRLNRDVVDGWLKRNYAPIRKELGGLTAAREGVPYAALFTQIWHEIFGLTTRELAAQGLVEDPRGADSPWNGSIPAVWRVSVYNHKLE